MIGLGLIEVFLTIVAGLVTLQVCANIAPLSKVGKFALRRGFKNGKSSDIENRVRKRIEEIQKRISQVTSGLNLIKKRIRDNDLTIAELEREIEAIKKEVEGERGVERLKQLKMHFKQVNAELNEKLAAKKELLEMEESQAKILETLNTEYGRISTEFDNRFASTKGYEELAAMLEAQAGLGDINDPATALLIDADMLNQRLNLAKGKTKVLSSALEVRDDTQFLDAYEQAQEEERKKLEKQGKLSGTAGVDEFDKLMEGHSSTNENDQPGDDSRKRET